MKILICLILPLAFLFQPLMASNNGVSDAAAEQPAKALRLYSLPWHSAVPAHFVKKDTADTTQATYPVWQKKVQPLKRRFFNITFRDSRSLLKPGLIFSTIVFNWSSFYLKRRADDYYRDYRRTSAIKRMNSFYKKTALYDKLSAAALGVAAASLSAFLYILWTD